MWWFLPNNDASLHCVMSRVTHSCFHCHLSPPRQNNTIAFLLVFCHTPRGPPSLAYSSSPVSCFLLTAAENPLTSPPPPPAAPCSLQLTLQQRRSTFSFGKTLQCGKWMAGIRLEAAQSVRAEIMVTSARVVAPRTQWAGLGWSKRFQTCDW